MVDDPQIIDREGFTQATGMTVDCRSADDGHQSWSTTVDAGQKSRIYGSWIIPVGAESALLEGHRIELPEPVGDTAAAAAPAEIPDFTPAPSASPAPAPAPAAPVVPAPAPVVGFTGAPGHDQPRVLDKTIASCGDPTMHQTGTTFFTDGTSGWTQDCATQMGY